MVMFPVRTPLAGWLSIALCCVACRSGGGADGDADADVDADADGAVDARADGADDADQPPPLSDAEVPLDGDLPPVECSFNSDCSEASRCECDETTGCFCVPGERGTGRSGVDECADGNDCASSLCVEGPGGVYYCSGECATEGDCGPALPLCLDVAFVGRICVRDPEG